MRLSLSSISDFLLSCWLSTRCYDGETREETQQGSSRGTAGSACV